MARRAGTVLAVVLAMKTLALEQLVNVTGAGASSLGVPIYGEQGCYLKYKNIGGQLHSQKSCLGAKPGPWVRDRSVLPSYDGDSSAGAQQG
jgi:hypothetical protein